MISEIENWKSFLSEQDKQTDIDFLKIHTNNGRPLGDSRFIEEIENLTGRALRRQKPGPKAKNDN